VELWGRSCPNQNTAGRIADRNPALRNKKAGNLRLPAKVKIGSI